MRLVDWDHLYRRTNWLTWMDDYMLIRHQAHRDGPARLPNRYTDYSNAEYFFQVRCYVSVIGVQTMHVIQNRHDGYQAGNYYRRYCKWDQYDVTFG